MTAIDGFVDVMVEPLRGRRRPLREKIINADGFFEHMSVLEATVVQLLRTNGYHFMAHMWREESYLPIDVRCRVRMGYVPSIVERLEEGKHPPTRHLYQKCRSCDAMDLLSSLTDISSGKPFYPASGEMKDQRLVVVKFDQVDPSVTEMTSLGDVVGRIIEQDVLSVSCQPDLPLLSETQYYALDKFTNALLTNWYISYVLSSRATNMVRKLYYPFICANQGYMLMESADYLSLLDYKITHVYQTWGLMFQLFSILHQLKDHQLSFQEIGSTTFLLNNDKCDFSYDGVNIVDGMTLVMNDFRDTGINVRNEHLSSLDKSSIADTKPIRLYRRHAATDEYFARISHRVISWSRHYSLVDVPGASPISWVTYSISPPEKDIHDYGLLIAGEPRRKTDADLEAFLHANRMGIPMYQGSFDAYRIMLLLCSNEGFYHSLIRNPELNMLWRSFWSPLEYDIINERIRTHHETPPGKYPYTRMLLGLNLRCNLISHVWKQLRHYAKSDHRPTHSIRVDTDVIIQSPPDTQS